MDRFKYEEHTTNLIKNAKKGEWDSPTNKPPHPWMRLCFIQMVKLFLIKHLKNYHFKKKPLKQNYIRGNTLLDDENINNLM